MAGQHWANSKYMPTIYRSTDRGETWKTYRVRSTPGGLYSVAADPINPEVIYTGGELKQGSYYRGAMFKSTNGGKSFKELSKKHFAKKYAEVSEIVVHPVSNHIVYAAADRYLYRSLNGGTAWKELDVRIDGSTYRIEALLLDPNNDQRVYMARGDGVFTSDDGGGSWTALNKGLSAPYALCLAYNPAKAYLFAGTSGGGLFRNLVKSLK